jgi:hypothetical protein
LRSSANNELADPSIFSLDNENIEDKDAPPDLTKFKSTKIKKGKVDEESDDE